MSWFKIVFFLILSLPHKPAESHWEDMKGRGQWWETILDKTKSVSAAQSSECGETVYYDALWDPDESQQEPSQPVNHPPANTHNKPWKQIINDDLTVNCSHKAFPVTPWHTSQWWAT